MQNFFRSTRFKVIISVVAALLAGAIFAAIAQSGDSPIASVVGTIFSPIQRLASFVSDSMENLSISFISSKTYADKVEELEKEIEGYREQLVDYEQTMQKNELYEAFLEVKEENPDFKVTRGTVIGKDSADLFGSFVLNKGSVDDVSVNDPVVYGKYLVGVVSSVSLTYCVVNTILDPKVNAAAYEVRTRETGYLSTTVEFSEKGLCKLAGLDMSTSVFAGGIVCTSGIGGIYPRDLIIGTVTAVENEKDDKSVYALIKPGTSIEQLEDVLIITEFDGQGVVAAISGD